MGKRIIISESEKLNIQNLYQGLLSEQQNRPNEEGSKEQNPEKEIGRVTQKPNPRKYLPISDEFCDIITGKAQVKKSAKGELVKLFQEALIKCGIELPKFGADGNFGNETRGAVRRVSKKRKFNR